jgi:hypothetical protein
MLSISSLQSRASLLNINFVTIHDAQPAESVSVLENIGSRLPCPPTDKSAGYKQHRLKPVLSPS